MAEPPENLELPPAAPPQPSVPPYILAARKRGRRIALVIYYGLVVFVCLAGAVQVTRQVLWNPIRSAPFSDCREGMAALVRALERARTAAPGNDGEDLAVERFRNALEPEWSYWDSIAQSCQGNVERERALDAIKRLRYAEEHAARWEAGDLAPLRRRVQELTNKEFGSAGGTPISPTPTTSAAEKP